jgi:hypothetical protein
METEIIKKRAGRKRGLIILIIFCSAFIIYYTIMSLISPAHKLEEAKNEFEVKTDANDGIEEGIIYDSLYFELSKDRSFLQSRIAMAGTDSIYLTINLNDSTANVEISGVIVHRAKMGSIRVSKIFLNGNMNFILSTFASPFTIKNDYSTIKKEPVMIKMAPKDTSEYKPDIMPDTSITEPVNYILELTDGTRIYVYEEEEGNTCDRISFLIFDFHDRLRNSWYYLKSVLLFKVPEYHPFIKIKLPRADAKIIYRAIPKNGQVGIYI